MQRWSAGAMVLVMTAAAGLAGQSLAGAATGSTRAGDGSNGRHLGNDFTFAVIGDIPYGNDQIAAFPERIDELNADPDVQLVDHLGDIKSGSSRCDDSYFDSVKTQFDRFDDPLVYTPGDNEWTDCHRTNNGAYDPLERLGRIGSEFFPVAGQTLGRNPMAVDSQAVDGYVENVSYERAGVAFAAVHIVGSNNSMLPWTGRTQPTPDQAAEVLGRTAADIQLIRDTFARARAGHDRAVVLLTQADMFDRTVPNPSFSDYYAFKPIVQAIVDESAAFDGPVYLFNGDSHQYREDQPLATGSSWLNFYGVRGAADNLTRVAVEGSTKVDEWAKVTIDKQDPAVLTVARVPFATTAPPQP